MGKEKMRKSGPHDKVELKDKLTIRLIDPTTRKVIKEDIVHPNTWTATGKNNVAGALAHGHSVQIAYMNATGATEKALFSSDHVANMAQFVAKWLSAEGPLTITGFAIRLTAGGADQATETFSVTKPVGIELEVTWQTTLS